MAIPSWLHLSQVSGSGDTIITITADTWGGAVQREAELLISGITKSVTVPVTQATHNYEADYLTFDILTPGTIYWYRVGSGSHSTTVSYRINGGSWHSLASQTAFTSSNAVTVNAGDVVEWRGVNSTYNTEQPNNHGPRAQHGCFYTNRTTGSTFNVKGNIMSMIYGDNFEGQYNFTANGAVAGLFYNGLGLVNTIDLVLPATGLTQQCYSGLFAGGYTMVTTPRVLPALNVPDYAYEGMFEVCCGLTQSSIVICATTVGNFAMRHMFSECYSLTTAPELPATTLGKGCYFDMFEACTSLTTVSENMLPATALAKACYDGMFAGCTSLTDAPKLPAMTLVEGCYGSMFTNCSSLSAITCLATTRENTGVTYNWVANVAPTGVFTKHSYTNWWTIGDDGIPTGWVIQDAPDVPYPHPETKYLTFDVLAPGKIYWWKHSNMSSYTETQSTTIQYRRNGGSWSSITSTTSLTSNDGIDAVAGDVFEWKGTNSAYGSATISSGIVVTLINGCFYLGSSGSSKASFDVKGNIMSMVYGDNFVDKYDFTSERVFYRLFYHNDLNISSENFFVGPAHIRDLVLPATGLTDWCYADMFNHCYGVSGVPPALPATTLAKNCYYGMFNHTWLSTAPELPATTLEEGCYSEMFDGCQLTSTPTLPATTLAKRCYYWMFANSPITTPPSLPVMTLADGCYGGMFTNSKITSAPVLPATALTPSCYDYMFACCTGLTSAPTLPATALTDSCYRNMFSGCTSLTDAPVLSASSLASRCYENMFKDCSSLSAITCLATTRYGDSNSATHYWVLGVAESGVFTKNASTTWWATGQNGIPRNWTVVDYNP